VPTDTPADSSIIGGSIMTVRTVRLAALLAGILLVTSGCFGFGAGGSEARKPAAASVAASPSPTSPPAKYEFVAALEKTKAGPFHFAVEAALPDNASVSGSGAFDGARQVYESTLTYAGGTSAGTHLRIAVGKDHFVREAKDKRWVHLDMSRVRKDNTLTYFDLSDPVGLTRFSSELNTVKSSGPNAYEGTFDASGASPAFLPLGAPSLWAIGYFSTPFKATTDDQGRVTAITIDMTQKDKPTITMKTTFSEHGKALTTKAPAKSQYAEADEMYYR
jgi:hypothetical protein